MIVFHTHGGRLGNQFFQAAFLNQIVKKNEFVFLTGMDQAEKVLDFGFRYFNLRKGLIGKFFDRILVAFILRPLVIKLRLFTLIKEIPDTGKVQKIPGFFGNIRWIEGYFQSEALWEHRGAHGFELKNKLKFRAEEIFNAEIPKGKTTLGIHWRKGDYLNYVVLGDSNPSLPISYFTEAISKVKEKIEHPYYLVFSDEPEVAVKELNLPEGQYWFSKNEPSIDIALMAKCEYLIISNSTLAWWAGWFKANSEVTSEKNIWAPEFWLGWKKQVWYPKGINPHFANLLTVVTNS